MEDECERSQTEEMEDEDVSSPADEDDEEDELTVLRPKRVSRSLGQRSPQVQWSGSQQGETGPLSSSGRRISAPPKRSYQFSKLRMQKGAPRRASVRRQLRRRRRQKDPYVSSSHGPSRMFTFLTNYFFCCSSPPKDDPVPEWLKDVMINIEEAKSHLLVVE